MNEQNHFVDSPSQTHDILEGLPELVDKLLNEQTGSRMELLDEIGNEIYHQGDIYVDKAGYVIPFFLQFLVRAQEDEQIALLVIIGLLIQDCQKAITSSTKDSDALKPLYSQLCEATPTYFSYLTHGNRQIRALVAFMLGYCSNTGIDLIAFLKTHYEADHDEYVQFAVIKALTTLHGYNEKEVAILFSVTTSKIVQHAIVLAMSEIYRDKIPSMAEEVLIEGLLDEERLDAVYGFAPYTEFSTGAIFHALKYVHQHKRVTILIRSIERWQFTGKRALLQLIAIVEKLFQCTRFPNKVQEQWFKWIDETTCEIHYRVVYSNRSQQIMLSELSQEQHQALICLLNCDYYWYQHTNFLEAYSLPATKQGLREMLHLS